MNDLSTIDLNDSTRTEMFSPKETSSRKEGGLGKENDQGWNRMDMERKEEDGKKEAEAGKMMSKEGKRREEGGVMEERVKIEERMVKDKEEGGGREEEERGIAILEWNIQSMKEILLGELLNESTLLKYE